MKARPLFSWTVSLLCAAALLSQAAGQSHKLHPAEAYDIRVGDYVAFLTSSDAAGSFYNNDIANQIIAVPTKDHVNYKTAPGVDESDLLLGLTPDQVDGFDTWHSSLNSPLMMFRRPGTGEEKKDQDPNNPNYSNPADPHHEHEDQHQGDNPTLVQRGNLSHGGIAEKQEDAHQGVVRQVPSCQMNVAGDRYYNMERSNALSAAVGLVQHSVAAGEKLPSEHPSSGDFLGTPVTQKEDNAMAAIVSARQSSPPTTPFKKDGRSDLNSSQIRSAIEQVGRTKEDEGTTTPEGSNSSHSTPEKEMPGGSAKLATVASTEATEMMIDSATSNTDLGVVDKKELLNATIDAAKKIAIDISAAIIEAADAAAKVATANEHSRLRQSPEQDQTIQAFKKAKEATLKVFQLSENSIKIASNVISASQALNSIDSSYGVKAITQAAQDYEKIARSTAHTVNQAQAGFTHYSFLSRPYLAPLKKVNLIKDQLTNASADLHDAAVAYVKKDVLPNVSLEAAKRQQGVIRTAIEKANVTVEHLQILNGFITRAQKTQEGHNSFHDCLSDAKRESGFINDNIDDAVEKANDVIKEKDKVILSHSCYGAALDRALIRVEKAINTAEIVAKKNSDMLQDFFNFVKTNSPWKSDAVHETLEELHSSIDLYQEQIST